MKTPLSSATVLAALIGGHLLQPAVAQSALPAEPEPAADGSEKVIQLDRIVVTSNRRSEEAQKVSGVVQSINADQLRKDGVTEVRQLQSVVPGLNISNQEGNIEIFIRGVGSANNTELGDPGAAPHLNGIYIPRPRGLGLMFYDLERVEVNKGPQGTLYGRNAMAGTLNILTARPRIGQTGGYFQGDIGNRDSGSAEGAVNIPVGEDFALRVAGFYSKKDAGYVNASPDPVSARLQPAGLEENYAGRISALWTPGDALSVSVVADVGHETGTGYPGANIYSAVTQSGLRAEDMDLRRVVYRGLQGEMDNELWGIQSKISYEFGPVIAEFSGSYRSVDFYQRNAQSDGVDFPGRDYTNQAWDIFSTQYWQTQSESTIAEFRLSSSDPKQAFRWSTGAFHFSEDQGVGYLSLVDKGYCCYSGTEFTMPKVNGKSTAIFADGTLDITKEFRALAGLRYSQESKYRYGIGGNIALVLGGADYACCMATRLGTEGFVPNMLGRPNFDMSKVKTPAEIAAFLMQTSKVVGARDTLNAQIAPIADGSNPLGHCFERADINNGFVTCPTDTNGGFSYANLSVPAQQVGRSKFHYADYRFGLEYDLNRDQMIYGKVSTGHKAGGFNDSFNGSTVPETFKPEQLTVFEVGSRNAFSLFGRRSVFNLTGFYYDYADQVFQDLTCISVDNTKNPPECSGYSLVNRNIGASRVIGLEAEARFALPGNFSFDLNAAYLDTKVTKGTVADSRAIDYGAGGKSPIVSLVGNKLPLASNFNLSARLQQVMSLGSGKLDWQALVNYRSDYYLTQFNEQDIVFLNGDRKTAQEAGYPDKQKGFTTLNLGLGYSLQNGVRVEAFGTNVTNEQASQKALVGPNVNVRFLNDARTYGVRMRYDF